MMKTPGNNSLTRHLFLVAKRVFDATTTPSRHALRVSNEVVAMCQPFATTSDQVIVIAYLYDMLTSSTHSVHGKDKVRVTALLAECFGRDRITQKIHVLKELVDAKMIAIERAGRSDVDTVAFTRDVLHGDVWISNLCLAAILDRENELLAEQRSAAFASTGSDLERARMYVEVSENAAHASEALDQSADDQSIDDDVEEEQYDDSVLFDDIGTAKELFRKEAVPASMAYFPDEAIAEQFEQILAVCSTDVSKILASYGLGRVASHYKPVRHQRTVILLSGAPGTGKTAAAYAMASLLQRDLYRTSADAVMAPYVGMTERNTRSLMREFKSVSIEHDEAPILLFDECEAFLSKRGSINHGSERSHNGTIDILLEEIETFEGILVLTTNTPSVFDQAFMRRIDYKLHLEENSPVTQKAVWTNALSIGVPGADAIDVDRLISRFNLTAAEITLIIRNTVISVVARDPKGHVLTQDHLTKACENYARTAGRSSIHRTAVSRSFGFV